MVRAILLYVLAVLLLTLATRSAFVAGTGRKPEQLRALNRRRAG
jgi:hypothetical protein